MSAATKMARKVAARAAELGCKFYDGAPNGDEVVFAYSPKGFRFAADSVSPHTAGSGWTGSEGDTRVDALRLALADMAGGLRPCSCSECAK